MTVTATFYLQNGPALPLTLPGLPVADDGISTVCDAIGFVYDVPAEEVSLIRVTEDKEEEEFCF